MNNSRKNSKHMMFANLGILIMAVVWGFGFIVTKDSIGIVTPLQIMVFRFAIGGIGLAIVFHKRLLKMSKAEFKHGLVLGILVFISYGLQTVGIKYTSASNNAFLTTLYVIIVPWLVYFSSGQKPSKTTIFASLMSFLGVGLMSITSGFSINIGDTLTIIGALVFGVHLLQISVYTQESDPIVLATMQLVVTAILSIIATSIFDPPIQWSYVWSEAKWSLVYLGVVNTLFTFLIQTISQKYTSPVNASLIMSLESVFAGVFSYFFLQERLSSRAFFGACLIFLAILVAQLDIMRKIKADEKALYHKKDSELDPYL